MTIFPYRPLGTRSWVFDDRARGLKSEAFVSGASEAIDRIVALRAIPDADQGFALTFADSPFDGYDAELVLEGDTRGVGRDEETPLTAGNWYSGSVGGLVMTGWLCPALLLFFPTAPERLYVRAAPLPAGVDPIWAVAPNDPRPRRFVSADGSAD